MKKNYLSKLRALFLLGVMLSANVVANAQIKRIKVPAILNQNVAQPMVRYDASLMEPLVGFDNVFVPKQNVPQQKEGQETANVQVVLDQERPEFGGTNLSVIDVNTGKSVSSYKLSQCPVGTYDFIMAAPRISAGGAAIVIKENIEIKNDTTIIFNMTEANNKISLETYKKDGELARPLLYQIVDNKYEIIDQGDYLWTYCRIHKKEGYSGISFSFYNQMSVEQENPEPTFFVNEGIEHYSFDCIGFIDDGEVSVFANAAEGMKEQVLKNKAEDYVWYEELFSLPPSFGQHEKDGAIYINFYTVMNGFEAESSAIQINPDFTLSKDGKVGFYVNCPTSIGEGDFNLLVSPQFGEECREVEIQEYDIDENGDLVPITVMEETYVWQVGTSAKVSKNGIDYIVSQLRNRNPNNYNESGIKQTLYPGHPAFGFTDKEKKLSYGDNCPLFVMWIDNGLKPYQTERNTMIDFKLRGNLGEIKEVLYDDIEETVKLDGEVIINNCSENELLSEITTGIEQGVFDVKLKYEKVFVDGLQGRSICTMQYDAAQEDWTPPTISMLQFRNTEGHVTDRFESASDGIVTFSGGNMEFHPNASFYGYYTIDNIESVTASYSPFNKDEWIILEGIEEVPEYYYYPEFGYFYRGSLKDVEGQGEKGWFDLKIRLEDAAGNWQEQVISPAFRIDDKVDTGIENNNQYTITNNNAVYDLMGRRMESQQKGISIVRRANGDVRKVVVK